MVCHKKGEGNPWAVEIDCKERHECDVELCKQYVFKTATVKMAYKGVLLYIVGPLIVCLFVVY